MPPERTVLLRVPADEQGEPILSVGVVRAAIDAGTEAHVAGMEEQRQLLESVRAALRACPRVSEAAAEAEARPEIVCLCGSTRFKDAFEAAERRLGMEGRIVLTVAMFGHAGDLKPEECTDGHPVKTALDTLHFRKIDLADRVLVLNVGGYIGDSTRREIAYAAAHGKPVAYLDAARSPAAPPEGR